MSGYTMSQPELYYALAANVTKNNWTTAAPFSSPGGSGTQPRCLIPANYFSVPGKSMHFEANGTITCNSAASFTFQPSLSSAAGTLASMGATAALAMSASANALPFTAEFDVTAQSVGHLATALAVNGEMDIHSGLSGAWGTGRNTSMIAASMTGVDNEAALFLELFGTWTVAATTNQTVLQMFKVYLEN